MHMLKEIGLKDKTKFIQNLAYILMRIILVSQSY